MALRTGHGDCRGSIRVEVLPADELPAGVPAPARPKVERDSQGRFKKGAGATEMARRGGEAASESRRLGRLLGLREIPDDHPYAPYLRMARAWREDQLKYLAEEVGGGQLSPGVVSIISDAALKLAASRWLYDRGAEDGDVKALESASRLSDAHRQGLLAAHELAAKEARAREVHRRGRTNQAVGLAAALRGRE